LQLINAIYITLNQSGSPVIFPFMTEPMSEQAGDVAAGVDVHRLGGGLPGQAGHEHDLAADRHHEAGAGVVLQRPQGGDQHHGVRVTA